MTNQCNSCIVAFIYLCIIIFAFDHIKCCLGSLSGDKMYRPQLLEGHLKQKSLFFDDVQNVNKNTHLNGYVVELIYDQPLYVHYNNKAIPLHKAPLKILNEFVSMKCNFIENNDKQEMISLGTNNGQYRFFSIVNVQEYDNHIHLNKTNKGNPHRRIGISTYLNYLETFERLNEQNVFHFWFSTTYSQARNRDIKNTCHIVFHYAPTIHSLHYEGNRTAAKNLLGNYHRVPLSSDVVYLNLSNNKDMKYYSEKIDVVIYENDDFKDSNNNSNSTNASSTTNGENDYCFDPSLNSALAEMEGESTADVMSSVMGGLVKTVVEGAIDLLWKPMTEQVTFRDGSNVEDDLVGKTETNNNAEAPQQIATMLDAALTYNLTNLLTDSVTAAVSPRVAASLSEAVGFQIKNVIYEHAKDKASDLIIRLVKPSIQSRLIKSIPRLVTSALLARMSNTLTRSITHAILPTVSRSVTQNNDQLFYCSQCYHYKKYCNYCHYSTSNSYYNVYYSAYYADYFSDYYGKYYTEALDHLKIRWCRNNKCKRKEP